MRIVPMALPLQTTFPGNAHVGKVEDEGWHGLQQDCSSKRERGDKQASEGREQFVPICGTTPVAS